MIDGPVEVSHPAFDGADLVQVDIGVRAARLPESSRMHGTHVASVLFGQPGGPVEGIVPACRGVLIPVFADGHDGAIRPCSELDLARALLAALRHGAHVINVSAGRLSGSGTAGAHLHDAVRQCVDAGVLVVAAAGNDGCDCLHVPAGLPGVLAVGAMDASGKPVPFSNWGSAYRERGILAPGTDIVGADAGGGVIRLSGTSFATPLVAGTAALLMSRQLEQTGRTDGRAVMQAIIDGADRCDVQLHGRCERFLAGALNIGAAVRRIDADGVGTTRPAGVRFARIDLGNVKGSEAMEQELGGIGAASTDAASSSIEAMAAALRSMEGTIADLGRRLGAIRASGLAPEAGEGTAPVAAAPSPAAEPPPPALPARSLGRRERFAERRGMPAGGDLIDPSACCDACAARAARQLVFALGKVGFDFGTEARFDSIQSQLENTIRTEGRRPSASNPSDLVEFLRKSKPHSPAITWTLNLDETPIYAIKPEGDYLEETYESLVDALEAQTATAVAAAAAAPGEKKPKKPIPPPAVERMSLPGIVNGEVELMNGMVIPTIRPALGAMYMWSTEALVAALDRLPAEGAPNDPGKPGAFDPRDGLRTFLNRIYEELRNVGLAPQDRALNFAATNAYQAMDIFVKIRGRNIHIEKFEVVRSPVMRPDSDCWDVKMTFFNPAAPTTTPREVYFYTIDVSDVVPVAIGKPRHWTAY